MIKLGTVICAAVLISNSATAQAPADILNKTRDLLNALSAPPPQAAPQTQTSPATASKPTAADTPSSGAGWYRCFVYVNRKHI